MELIPARPPVTVSFGLSLPYDLFATLILLDEPQPGVSDWIVRTRARLPDGFARQLHLAVGALRYVALLWGRLTTGAPDDAARRSFAPFRARVAELPADEYRTLALESVAQRLARWEVEADRQRCAPEVLARSRRRLAGYLEALQAARTARRPGLQITEPPGDLLADLLLDGARLKELIGSTLDVFWKEYYAERFAADLPQLQAAVARQAGRQRAADFPALLLDVTGRTLPEVMARQMDGVAHVEFVPNMHLGPYLVFTTTPPSMTIAFNAQRTAPAAVRAPSAAQRLLPALDALSDETRLQIVELLHARGELYAHEIAQTLGLSASSVSRHLARLEATGVVRVRRAGPSKYYSLDAGHARALVARLRDLMGVA